MEPAVDRREHFQQLFPYIEQVRPQWSPPLIGGSTLRAIAAC